MDLIAFILIYFIAGIVVSILSYRKGLFWLWALLLSILLTPVAGILYYQSKRPVKIFEENRYKCPRCKFYFTEQHPECPYCKKDGEEIKLRRVKVDMT